MTGPLHNTESPLNRGERRKVNENWESIKDHLVNLQRQIKVLAGGEEVGEILARIETAITNAQNVTGDAQTALDNVTNALAQLTTVIGNANAAASRADIAANEANQFNVILNRLKDELETLQADLNGIVQAEAQRVTNENERKSYEVERNENEDERKDNENDRALAEQSRVTAETSRETAEGLRNDAEVIRQQKLAELLAIINELDFKGEYDPTLSYKAFNVVRYGRASYVALQDVSGVLPNDGGIEWRILAAGGMDGAGAVSTVNNIEPDGNGNINLIIDYINNVTSDRIDAGLSAAMGKFLMSLITALQNDKVDAAFVDAEVNRLIAAAPGMLDTFEEIANALNNDPNFANTIIHLLNDKASNAALATTNNNLAQTNTNLTALDNRLTTHLGHLKDKENSCAKFTHTDDIVIAGGAPMTPDTPVVFNSNNNFYGITVEGNVLRFAQAGVYHFTYTFTVASAISRTLQCVIYQDAENIISDTFNTNVAETQNTLSGSMYITEHGTIVIAFKNYSDNSVILRGFNLNTAQLLVKKVM